MTSAIRLAETQLPKPRPFLKWAGGKSKLVETIMTRFPHNFGRYFEPFLGGGAVYFGLEPERAVLADMNLELVTAYTALRDELPRVLAALRRHRANREHFYAVRAQDASGMSPTARAARMIFLNRTCYNGLYRVNRSGAFNVPFGKYDNPTICDEENLRAVSHALQDATIEHSDVFSTVAKARAGDLVYFDPPYDPVSKTASFVSYTDRGFTSEDQERLAQTFRDLADRGVHAVLSNSDTPFIRKLYKGFRVDTVHVRRAINSRADRRGPVAEVLVSTT